MSIVDRLVTIVVTATLTSAAWIVAGSGFVRQAEDRNAAPPAAPAAPGAERTIPARSAVSAGQVASSAGRVAAAPGRMTIPVVGIAAGQLVDTYTQSREGGARLHEAIDIMAPRGTPVVAAAPGRVEKLFVSARGGNTVYVRSTDGSTIHYYAHLDAYAPTLREGAVLAAGDPVGTVGSTGNASPQGPHLHFAVMQTSPDRKWWDEARPINPYPLLTAR